MRTKLFITGMGGMTGRVIAKQALEKKYIVGGTINKKTLDDFRINNNSLKAYSVDLKNLDETLKAISDFNPDVIIHLAGKVLGGADKKVLEYSVYKENVLILKNVLQATKKLTSHPRFILTSGCLVYDKQTSPKLTTEIPIYNLPKIDSNLQPYRASKADQEKMLIQEKDLDYIIVRPTQFTGPGKIPGVIEWYIAMEISRIIAEEKTKINVKNKLGEIDLLDVRDVASAYLLLTEKGNKGDIFHISSGQPKTVEMVAKKFLKVAGLNPSQFPIESTDIEQTVYFRFSPVKLNKLGWKPKFSLEDTLTSYWEYFKKQ